MDLIVRKRSRFCGFRVELVQTRKDFLGKKSNACRWIGIVKKAVLPEHQQVPKPATGSLSAFICPYTSSGAPTKQVPGPFEPKDAKAKARGIGLGGAGQGYTPSMGLGPEYQAIFLGSSRDTSRKRPRSPRAGSRGSEEVDEIEAGLRISRAERSPLRQAGSTGMSTGLWPPIHWPRNSRFAKSG